MSKPNSDTGDLSGLWDKLRGVPAHPLTLLIVGALLSSLLIPSWTKQWQDRQSELQVKIDLIDQLNNSVTEMVMSVQFAILGAEGQSQADYDRAYRQWEIDSRLVGSQLQAYYPTEPLAKDWDRLSREITDLYAGSQAGYPQTEFLRRKNALIEQTDELNNRILNTPIAVFH